MIKGQVEEEEAQAEEEVAPEISEEEATRDPAAAETTSIKMILYMTRA